MKSVCWKSTINITIGHIFQNSSKSKIEEYVMHKFILTQLVWTWPICMTTFSDFASTHRIVTLGQGQWECFSVVFHHFPVIATGLVRGHPAGQPRVKRQNVKPYQPVKPQDGDLRDCTITPTPVRIMRLHNMTTDDSDDGGHDVIVKSMQIRLGFKFKTNMLEICKIIWMFPNRCGLKSILKQF